MIILVESTYPGTKLDDTIEAFLKQLADDPYPEHVTLQEIYAVGGGEGFRSLAFYEVAEGKEYEGYKFVGRHVANLMSSVEGYKADMHLVHPLAEAFEIIGREAPEI